MRRMKDMAAIQSGMAFYGELPDSYNLIVNTDHPLSQKVIADTESACKSELTPILDELKTVNEEIERLQEAKKDKKDDEIPVADKEALKHESKGIGYIEDLCRSDTFGSSVGRLGSAFQ